MTNGREQAENGQTKRADRRCVVSSMSAAVTFVALVAATSNLSLGQAINAFVYRVSLPVLAAIVVVSFLLLCTVGEGTNTRLWQDISKALSIASFAAVILSACAVGGAAAFVLF